VFGLQMKDFEPQAGAAGLETGGLAGAMDRFISFGPHGKEQFLDGGYY
jgi:hypothetical protein